MVRSTYVVGPRCSDSSTFVTLSLSHKITTEPIMPEIRHSLRCINTYDSLYGCTNRPQLMMYVDGEFVWIPASRVPEALNFIAV